MFTTPTLHSHSSFLHEIHKTFVALINVEICAESTNTSFLSNILKIFSHALHFDVNRLSLNNVNWDVIIYYYFYALFYSNNSIMSLQIWCLILSWHVQCTRCYSLKSIYRRNINGEHLFQLEQNFIPTICLMELHYQKLV